MSLRSRNSQIVETTLNDIAVECFDYDSAQILVLSGQSTSSSNAADTAKFEQCLSCQSGANNEAKDRNGVRVHFTYNSRNRDIERSVKKSFSVKILKYQWNAKDQLIGGMPRTGDAGLIASIHLRGAYLRSIF